MDCVHYIRTVTCTPIQQLDRKVQAWIQGAKGAIEGHNFSTSFWIKTSRNLSLNLIPSFEAVNIDSSLHEILEPHLGKFSCIAHRIVDFGCLFWKQSLEFDKAFAKPKYLDNGADRDDTDDRDYSWALKIVSVTFTAMAFLVSATVTEIVAHPPE